MDVYFCNVFILLFMFYFTLAQPILFFYNMDDILSFVVDK